MNKYKVVYEACSDYGDFESKVVEVEADGFWAEKGDVSFTVGKYDSITGESPVPVAYYSKVVSVEKVSE